MWRHWFACRVAAVTVIVFSVILAAAPHGARASTIEGAWNSTYGRLTLVEIERQDAPNIFYGRYRENLGVIYGYTNGKVARGVFAHLDTATGKLRQYESGENNFGVFEWKIAEDGSRFTGPWRWGRSVVSQNDLKWSGSRAGSEQVELSGRVQRFGALQFLSAGEDVINWAQVMRVAPPKLYFDWEMPDRYGPDKNGNSIVDLPNSRDYVQNRGDVPEGVANPCLASGIQCAGRPPLFAVNLTLEERAHLLKYKQKANVAKILWTVRANDGVNQTANGFNPTVYLPEGRNRVSVEIAGRPETRLTRTIDVQDFFIALMGDSFGAGEGAPERLYPEGPQTRTDKTPSVPVAAWADPGIVLPRANPNGTDPWYRPDWATMEKTNSRASGYYSRLFQNMRSHRSSYTHASQLALRLENRDKKSSVTFVNLAQSGATMQKGMLGNYDGHHNEPFIGGSYCDGRPGMCPQVDELSELTGDRQLDHVYMSIGGNDAGFSYILGLLASAWPWDIDILPEEGPIDHDEFRRTAFADGTVAEVLAAAKSGRWDQYRDDNPYESAIFSDGKPHLPGLDGLLNTYGPNSALKAYGDLDIALEDLNIGKLRLGSDLLDAITLIPPPFFGTFDTAGKVKSRSSKYPEIRHKTKNYRYCSITINSQASLDSKEIAWAEWKVYEPLVQKMNEAASRFGWQWITHSDDVYDHGLCAAANSKEPGAISADKVTASAPHRWFNTPDDGKNRQTGNEVTNKGMFHPNEFGFGYIRERLFQRMRVWARADNALRYILNTASARGTLYTAEPVSRQKYRNGVAVSLDNADEVAMYRLWVPFHTDVTITLKSPDQTSDCAAITVFDENGAVLASNSKVLSDDLKRNRPFKPIDLKKCLRANVRTIMRNDEAAVTLMGDPSAPCDASERRRIHVGVSRPNNVFYDPVTSRGDLNAVDRYTYGAYRAQMTVSEKNARHCQ